jgi:hypothetical protein
MSAKGKRIRGRAMLMNKFLIGHAEEIQCVNGQCWTRNGLEFRNGGEESLLSSILETGEIESRYFLKPTTCEKLLKRMEIKNKSIPPKLKIALEAVAFSTFT